ncbi:MAG: DUF4836 family protein [Bacteroidetes bacterium]|nr:DUF4836 family protein [Bacteroidota bacterium]
MKKLFSQMFAVVVVAVMLASCGSKGLKQASLIPKDASVVAVFDQKTMEEKLKAGNFQMDSIMNKFISSVDSAKAKKLMTDWKNSGINTEEKVVMFLTQTGKKGKIMGFNVIASLKDAAKFEAFLKGQEELKTEAVVKGKTYTSMKMGKSGLATWTSEFAMLSFATNTNYFSENAEVADVTAMVDKYYNLKDAEKVTSIKAFNEMLDKKADITMFTSSASIGNSLAMMPFQVPKLEELLKDNYSVSYMNFENGKIVMETTSYLNDRLNALLKQYGNGSIKASMLESFPAKNTNAAMLLSVKPDAIQGILKELQLETLIDAGLSSAKMNFTLQDIYKCLKGDMAFALGDFEMKAPTDSMSYAGPQPTMKILFNAEVGDKASLAKILDQGVQMQMLINNAGVYTLNPQMAAGAPVYVRIDDKNIIIATDENTYTQYAAKSTKTTLNKDFTSELTGKYMAMFVDANSFLKAFEGFAGKDPHAKVIMDKALTTFDNVIVTGDNLNDVKYKGLFTFKMKNEKENSLVSLANFIKTVTAEMQVADQERKAKWNDVMPMVDTVAAAVEAPAMSK